MRIYAFADIHGRTERLSAVARVAAAERPALLVAAGDLAGRRRLSPAVAALDRLGLPVLVVAGNGDGAGLAAAVAASERLVMLDAEARCWEGVPFAGIGGTLPLPFGTRVAWRERAALASLADRLPPGSVLVAHPPPRGVQDRVAGRLACGSRGLRDLVLARRPVVMICGHVHEDAGIGRLGGSLVVNASMGRGGLGAIVTLGEGPAAARMVSSA
jgi:hypothetical protein